MIYEDEGQNLEAHSCPVCGSDSTRIFKERPGEYAGNGWEEEEVWTIECDNCRIVRLALPANDFMDCEKYFETVQEAVMEWNSLCEKYEKQKEEASKKEH